MPDAPRIVVVAGTDTGVGKTVVTAGLARALSDMGVAVRAIKPIESGCDEVSGANEDGVLLALAARQTEPAKALVRLRAPIAPPAAAEREDTAIDFDAVVAEVREYARGTAVTLVEGAGGLMSPLTWEHTVLDLARALEAPVILVASDRLGAVHHVRSAWALLAAARRTVLQVVLSAPPNADSATGDNADLILRMVEWKDATAPLVLPRVHGCEEAALALDHLARSLIS